VSGRDNGSPIVDGAIPLGDHPTTPIAAPAGELLTLTLDDLIPDTHGEVVILSDAGHDIALVTQQPVASQGIEASHVTATGLDVSGYAYCTFADGLTLFYPPSQRFFVTDEG
jgi:hypothetical protein